MGSLEEFLIESIAYFLEKISYFLLIILCQNLSSRDIVIIGNDDIRRPGIEVRSL